LLLLLLLLLLLQLLLPPLVLLPLLMLRCRLLMLEPLLLLLLLLLLRGGLCSSARLRVRLCRRQTLVHRPQHRAVRLRCLHRAGASGGCRRCGRADALLL